MRLIIATGIYPPDIGGPATYSKQLAEALSKDGWKVTVLAYGECPSCSTETDAGFKVIKISRKHNVFIRYFLYAWRLIKLAREADLIYAQGPVSEGLPAYFASKLLGKKYALKVVGDCAWERLSLEHKNIKTRKQEEKNSETEKLGNCQKDIFIAMDEFQQINDLPLKTKILQRVQKLVARNAACVITPSQYLKGIVKQWGVSENKIRVVYNALESQKSKVKCQMLVQSEISGDIILSGGRLVTWKGFDTLIDIMPELWKINPNFKLVIVGEGQEYMNLKDKIKSLCGRDGALPRLYEAGNIVLTGKLEHEKLLHYMRKSRLFVLNSGYEGLSHLIIEAMESGLPVAVSNIGGNPELVEDGRTGLLFEYNNKEQIKEAVVRIWQNKELRDRLISNAKSKTGEFSFEKMIKETKIILITIKGK